MRSSARGGGQPILITMGEPSGIGPEVALAAFDHFGGRIGAHPIKLVGDACVLAARKDFPALMRRCARWDFSVSSNTFSTLIWERVYPSGPYESHETG